jgi:TrkA-N domain
MRSLLPTKRIGHARTTASAPSMVKSDGLSLRRLRSIWRERLRPVWQDFRPVVVLVLAAAVLILGTIGFQDYQRIHHLRDYSPLDGFYRALQLFGFGATLEPRIPVTLQIARLLGPFVAGYAVFRGLLVLSREQLQIFWFRFFLRNHVVVAGLGTAGYRMAISHYERGYRVVAIERDAAHPAIQGCRQRGIGVLKGDAMDKGMLEKSRVDRARTLIVTCGSDAVNMNIATAASAYTSGRRFGVLTALVHLDDFSFLVMMKAQSLTNESSSTFRLALFNVYATGAQMLLEKHPPFGAGAEQQQHVLIVGFEGVARSLAVNVFRQWLLADSGPAGRLLVTFAGPSAEEDRKQFLSRHPEIDQLANCELAAWNVDFTASQLLRKPLAVAPTRTYVCVASETQALTITLALSRRDDTVAGGIVVVLPDESSGMAAILRSGGEALRNVEAFGLLAAAFSPKAVEHTTNEILAMASHETHLDSELAKGATAKDDPSLVSWEDLPDGLKESNRLFADDIPAKLAKIGCVTTPAPLANPTDDLVEFTPEEVKLLAPLEHDRWSDDCVRHLGMRKTSGVKDTARGLHPLIGVPFDDLPEENKEKDRAKVRSVPEILARAGFEIVRMTDSTSPEAPRTSDEQNPAGTGRFTRQAEQAEQRSPAGTSS